MNQNTTTPLNLCFSLILSSASLTATPIVLDFEEFPTSSASPGVAIPLANRLSTQHLNTFGVRFSSAAAYLGVVTLGTSGTTSGIMAISGATLEDKVTYQGAYFIAEFFDPTNTNSLAVTNFFSVRGDTISDGTGGTLRAFGVHGQLIGEQSIPNVAGNTFTISAPGIHRVTFTGSGTIGLDDVSFNAVIALVEPESVQAAIHPAVQVAWPSVVGKTYQVQSTSTLGPANWTNFGAPITGDGNEKFVFDNTRNENKKFYRVLIDP